MKYKCLECNQTFIHTQKRITTSNTSEQIESWETYHCPYCKSQTYTEYTEPQPEIVSVKSVPLEEVDSMLTQGYVVRELYAKTATLVKLSEPAKPQRDLAEENKQLEQEAAQLRAELAGFMKEA